MSRKSKLAALVVSDDKSVITGVCRILSEQGFTVVSSADLPQAQARLQSMQPWIIVLDMSIAGGSGIQLLEDVALFGSRTNVLLVANADEAVLNSALRLAEEQGINTLGAFLKPLDMEQVASSVATLTQAQQQITLDSIESAMRNREFCFHYQPIVNLRSGQVAGCEALIRWNHPEKGLLPPQVFIELIESPSVARDIVEYSIGVVLEDRERYFPGSGYVAINVPPSVLCQRKAADWIMAVVGKCQGDPKDILIEVTERLETRSFDTFAMNVTQLRLAGFGIALDDFGTGNSSLLRLYRVPFSLLKIDQLFVMGSHKNRDAMHICRLLGRAGKLLKRATVAEGIESQEVALSMVRAGIVNGQGYYWSKPIAADAYGLWCSEFAEPNLTTLASIAEQAGTVRTAEVNAGFDAVREPVAG